MIANQSNYPDKNHKSIAVIKSSHWKNARPNHLPAKIPLSEQQQKYPLVSIHESEYESREHPSSSGTSSTQVHQSNVQYKSTRIPTTTTVRNFNQISKAPTNLWNGIYEKHLLNQTKFDRTVDDKWTNKCASNGISNGMMRKNWETNGVSNIQLSESNFNNNSCQNELRPTTSTFRTYEPNPVAQFALMRRHIDPQLTIAEPCMIKKGAKIRMTNRPTNLSAEHQQQQQQQQSHAVNNFHKQINNFDPNGISTAGTGKVLLTEMKANKNASNDLHLGLSTPPVSNVQSAGGVGHEQRHRFYAYSSETQIPSEMGFMYVQPGVIEKNLFCAPLPLLYNGHNKQIKNEINDADCHMYKNVGVLTQAYNRISGNICLERGQRGQRGQPVGGNHLEDSSVPVQAFGNVVGTATATKMASLSVVSAVNAKVSCNTFENAITSSTVAPASVAVTSGGGGGGESTLATNCEYTSNSKINIMLETAQAMAAAAYFARLVLFTQ